jgi:signal peptidase I
MKDWVKIFKEIKSWVILFVLALFFSALINSQLFAMATVKEVSMQDTLFEDQILFINRLAYKNKSPKAGDIIIFYKSRDIGSFTEEFLRSVSYILPFTRPKDDNKDRLVKRVIGTSGDIIDIKDGYVYKNGERLEEPYAKGDTNATYIEFPVTVGENQLFVLGDNREHSRDSREFGLIDISHVEGKASFRLYPFNKIGKLQ